MSAAPPYQEIRFTTNDGLELYARDYGAANDDGPAVLCLCGLTRNSRDFEPLANHVSRHCRMVALDFRGRGRSAYAADPQTYRPGIELADTLRLLDLLNIARAGVIGTSRGGIVAMLMAATHPQRIAGAVLNDIGPVLEPQGLLRIRSYLGKTPPLNTWEEAAATLRRNNSGFEALTPEEWQAFARRVYRDDNGQPKLDYDPRLADTFPTEDAIRAEPPPTLWPLFEALALLPVTVLRGENSDLLSAETVAAMERGHPHVKSVTVRNRGHAPFLDEPESLAAIRSWLDELKAIVQEPAG